MIIDLLYLVLWSGIAWTTGAATVGNPGPYGLGAWVRAAALAYMPESAWWALPAMTGIGVLVAGTYVVIIVQTIAEGIHQTPDGVLRDGAGRPIWRLGPFWGRR